MKKELAGIYTIWLRDIKRYYRDKPRIIGSFAQPILFLVVLGSGLASSFAFFGSSRGGDYLDFMFPGIVGMTVLFTSFFGTMSIVWDREFGFLKEMLVSPVSRVSIVIGKILGSSTIALIQGAIILLFSPLLSRSLTVLSVVKSFGLMFLVAVAISSMGILLASVVKTMQGFQVITNFLLMPMFFLSGAIFPLIEAPQWMIFLSKINPLTYGIDAIRYVMLQDISMQVFPLWINIVVLLSLTAAASISGAFLFNRQQ